MVQQKEKMKLKHKGRAVKAVKVGKNCADCIFNKDCNNGNLAKSILWEKDNKLITCGELLVKYIYA